jgi:glycerophosphoryl diester phosphodiesterase
LRVLPAAALVVCALASTAAPTQAQRFEDNPWWSRQIFNIAHAGGECEAPANTLYGLKTSVAKGADMIEFDVQSSADGVLVVIHDETVDRVTNGSGRVVDMTLAELQALDKAWDYTPHGGEGCPNDMPGVFPFRGVATGDVPPPPGFAPGDFRIATVREVLETFPDTLLSIEIKGAPANAVATAERLAALLREFGRSDDVLVASFDDRVINRFKAAAPEIHTTPGPGGVATFFSGGAIPQHQALQVPPVLGGLEFSSPETVAYAHERGMPIIVFLQEDTEYGEVYDALLDAGVDGIITGRPTAMRAKLVERGLVDADEPASDGDGCQVGAAAAERSAAWLLPGLLALVAQVRRRPDRRSRP